MQAIGYDVKVIEVPAISHELIVEIYEKGNYKDPHSELAARLNMSRQEAKRLMYNYMYSLPITKRLMI